MIAMVSSLNNYIHTYKSVFNNPQDCSVVPRDGSAPKYAILSRCYNSTAVIIYAKNMPEYIYKYTHIHTTL